LWYGGGAGASAAVVGEWQMAGGLGQGTTVEQGRRTEQFMHVCFGKKKKRGGALEKKGFGFFIYF